MNNLKYLSVLLLMTIAVTACGKTDSVSSGSNSTNSGSTVAIMSPEDSLKWLQNLPEPKPNKPYKLGVPLVYLSDPLWVGFEYGIRDEAKKLGLPDPIITAAGGYTKADVQISQTEDMLTKGIDGLLLAPANQDSLVPVAQQAIKAGVPVLNFAISMQGKNVNTISDVEVDNVQIGAQMAKYMGDALKGKGKALLLPGVSGTAWSIDREKGFTDYLKTNYPDIVIVDKKYSDVNRGQALSITADLLQAHPDINGIMTASDILGAGASDAVRAIGKQGKIVIVTTPGISKETQDLIQNGDITSTSSYPAVEEGRWLVKIMVAYLNGDKNIPKNITLPIENIDKSKLSSIDLSKYRAPEGYTPGK